ncbi:hydrogenase nickel incorporation protein HypA/HybF [Geosporobacter subterraneus DSM 17957]|uniref:Hydrogenase maturation factor HypA n=1 Tax=Geosporobacter subterraneus DSM 17957 TaxID=1121919 RepID=A0A1M6D019_9FIRM|nr:hydrogenase maturation nickel metallochaperone HypA [Geosporobacter subterraneus]SHI66453.1 hydrogenase nickel incorporation protein HypA/HybF [Geosporobacter subterraneus DSM 17957]
MHEVSITADLFEIIEENITLHKLNKISKVGLKIGEMTCLEESALRFSFEAFSKDTAVEGAELIIERVKATALCSQCGDVYGISFYNKICPQCSSFSNDVVTGYELFIDTLEGE